ncbi:hypothetical protein KIL84_022753 [Mauremys mutica]|uniref:Uncharacterized protein n=1 Tax=Mauremys mutica TaxID=74926 RepID=A0A9D4AP89_9SAUR|nr:hypothetical protein KIL84_022753 [Mauremys mutica]
MCESMTFILGPKTSHFLKYSIVIEMKLEPYIKKEQCNSATNITEQEEWIVQHFQIPPCLEMPALYFSWLKEAEFLISSPRGENEINTFVNCNIHERKWSSS